MGESCFVRGIDSYIKMCSSHESAKRIKQLERGHAESGEIRVSGMSSMSFVVRKNKTSEIEKLAFFFLLAHLAVNFI